MAKNYIEELTKIVKDKENTGARWGKLYTTLSELYLTNDQEKIKETENIFVNIFVNTVKAGVLNPHRSSITTFFSRRSSTSKTDTDHKFFDEFITGYSMELRKHEYRNDDPINVFNAKLIAKIINKFLEEDEPEFAFRLLQAFEAPELLKSIVAVQLETTNPKLLSYAKVYSYLNDIQLYKVALFSKSEVYKLQLPTAKSGDKDSLLAAIFLQKLKIIQTQMRLAQAWSINKTYIAGSDLELGASGDELQAIELRLISTYVKDHKKPELIDKMRELEVPLTQNEIDQIVTKSLDQLTGVDYEDPEHKIENDKFLKDPSKPRYIIMHFEYNGIGHAVAIAFWQDKICIVNRGGFSGPGNDGLRIYSIAPEERSKLLTIATSRGYDERDVVKYIQDKANFLYHMPMTKQSAQNCTWVAAKSLSWAAAYFNALQFMIANNKAVDENVAKQIATATYKFLVRQRKINTLHDYLQLGAEDRGDPNLLAAAYIKLRNPKWSQKLEQLSDSFSPETRLASDKLLARQFNDAIKIGNDKIVEKLLPIVKSTNLETTNDFFKLALLNAAVNVGNEYFEKQFKVLQLLMENGIVETTLKYAGNVFTSLEEMVEYVVKEQATVFTDGVDAKQNKTILLESFKVDLAPDVAVAPKLGMSGP